MKLLNLLKLPQHTIEKGMERDQAIAEELFSMTNRLDELRMQCGCVDYANKLKTASNLIGSVADEVQRGYWRLQYQTSPKPKVHTKI